MTLRLGLRWKVLLLALVTPAVLALATLLLVNRSVTRHVDSSSIHESLAHSAAVFENMLENRMRDLSGSARVIARDPRFFSLIMLGPSQHDSRFIATVRGMARDFNLIAQTDLFEVLDRRGRVMASVGRVHSTPAARADLVRKALRGHEAQGVLIERAMHYQASMVPVTVDGRVVGLLVLGREIGPALARELRTQMLCEVTFLSDATVTGTTLDAPGDLAALVRTLSGSRLGGPQDPADAPIQRIQAPHASYLTVVRHIPGSEPEARQYYVIQRAFDPELEFLGHMRRDLIILALVALAVALVNALIFGERLLRPVRRLVRGAQAMERGDYDYPLEGSEGDELGYLTTRFAEMRRRERAYLDRLERAGQLKSRFLGVASRELRSPLSVLIGYNDLLTGGDLGPVAPRQLQALETMRTQLDRLAHLADDAALVARVKGERLVIDPQPSDVPSLLNRAVRSGRAAGARRLVQVEGRCEEITGLAHVDPASLELAVFHLITNGIRSTADGGRVDVVARAAAGRLVIEVADTGVGMAAERLAAVLAGEPSDHEPLGGAGVGLEFGSRGLGLGLSIVSAIAEAHGGTLRAASEPGAGSRFTLDVPMCSAESERAAA